MAFNRLESRKLSLDLDLNSSGYFLVPSYSSTILSLQCSKLCGPGVQTRKATCFEKKKGKKVVLNEADCGEKPEVSKECVLRPCEGVDWIASSWSGVSRI